MTLVFLHSHAIQSIALLYDLLIGASLLVWLPIGTNVIFLHRACCWFIERLMGCLVINHSYMAGGNRAKFDSMVLLVCMLHHLLRSHTFQLRRYGSPIHLWVYIEDLGVDLRVVSVGIGGYHVLKVSYWTHT